MKSDASPLKPRRRLWPLFGVLSAVVLGVIPRLPPPYSSHEVLIAAMGGVWALAFYLHSQHGEDARFLKELLTEFNGRYNQLNNDLQFAIWRKEPFTPEEDLNFIDYFNLCAEEWLFWKGGYIPHAVWNAWRNGMQQQYGTDPRVKKLWQQERKSNSYYGFEFPFPSSGEKSQQEPGTTLDKAA